MHTAVWWGWGSGGSGQLGLYGDTSDYSHPQRLPDPPSSCWRLLVGGPAHTLALTGIGEVWSWGSGDEGQLGRGPVPMPADGVWPERVVFNAGADGTAEDQVEKLAAGWNHSLALTSQGQLWCWGSSRYNQIGVTGEETKGHMMPTLMRGLDSTIVVKEIAAGLRHTAMITQGGKVLTLGYGKFGELGHGDNISTAVPTVVQALTPFRVCQVACGQKHTVCLTEDGQVYTWGDNTHGQLGVEQALSSTNDPNMRSIQAPTPSPSPSSGKKFRIRGAKRPSQASSIPQHVDISSSIMHLTCGWNFTMAVSDVGVYVFGRNNYGQLGLGDTIDRPTPTLLQHEAWNGAAISKLLCGSEHALLLAGGELYAWGWNEHGNLGLGDTRDRHAPCRIEQLVRDGLRVIDVCTGGTHSFCLTTPKE